MKTLKFLLLFNLLFILNPSWAMNVPPYYSIVQGATSDSQTHFTLVVRQGESLKIRATDINGRVFQPDNYEIKSEPGSIWQVHRLGFSGLLPGVEYSLEVRDESGRIRDQRYFSTLASDQRAGRIGLASCMLRQFHNPFIWNHLEEEQNRPDILLITGDSVYLDRRSLLHKEQPSTRLQVWNEFAYSRNTLNLYFWKHLVPIVTTWDDHDAGGDNVDSTYFLMPEVRQIYETFFANESIEGAILKGPGLAKNFRALGHNVIMLDGRSFRNAEVDSPMFGKEQENWLLSQLRPGTNFLVNGAQFFGGYLRKDSYEYNWPEAFKLFIQRLRTRAEQIGAKIAFVSGDVHYSEIQEIPKEVLGYTTYEITSSSAHSMGLPGMLLFKPYNPRRQSATEFHNVVLLEFSGIPKDLAFSARAIGMFKERKFEQYLIVEDQKPKTCENLLAGKTTR